MCRLKVESRGESLRTDTMRISRLEPVADLHKTHKLWQELVISLQLPAYLQLQATLNPAGDLQATLSLVLTPVAGRTGCSSGSSFQVEATPIQIHVQISLRTHWCNNYNRSYYQLGLTLLCEVGSKPMYRVD